MIPVLARCLVQIPDGSGGSGHGVSLADAEAACSALANVLRHSTSAALDTALACSQLAACGAMPCCTAALRRAAISFSETPHVDYAARAAEALQCIVDCAIAASVGSVEAASLVGQAAAAKTEAAVRALQLTLEARPSQCTNDEELGLRRSLAALAAALHQWLAATY